MKDVIAVIRRLGGFSISRVGLLFAWFDDPTPASLAQAEIEGLGFSVEQCGTQLRIIPQP